MKIAYCSDVHLEFGPLTLKNEKGADLLILAGDICVAEDIDSPKTISDSMGKRTQRYMEFFESASNGFKDVIYIPGNHEFYHGEMNRTEGLLNRILQTFPNIQYMDGKMVQLNGFNIFAGTMWTNFKNEDPTVMYAAESGMNDYRLIQQNGRLFSPSKALEIHKKYLEGLTAILDGKTPTIVVSHHGPTTASVHPRYKTNETLNWAYHSDLSNLILDNPQIKLWFHGHTHHPQDYMVGSTRVLCNPRGYHGYEKIEETFELEYIDTETYDPT